MARPVPSVMNYFCSFYNPSSTTYLPAVNVKKHLEAHPCPSEAMAKAANNVKNSLESGIVPFINMQNNERMLAHSLKVVDPDALSQKRASHLETCRSTSSDAFLQIAMASRIKEVASQKKLEGVKVIDQYAAGVDCLVTPELTGIKSIAETRDWIKQKSGEEQRVLANKLICWIKEVGFVNAQFESIRINDQGDFLVLTTRPFGLLVEEGAGRSQGHSVEKCARVGLFRLYCAVEEREGLEEFAKEVKRHYDKSLSDYSWTRIILSILCPLIPLVFLIISIYKSCIIKSLADAEKETDINRYYDEIENVLF